MQNDALSDVPSPIDFHSLEEAREWESGAMIKRPFRTEIFECFAAQIAANETPVRRVLELGSGPGFLARHLLERLDIASYALLDFSAAMHDLALHRLDDLKARALFIERDLKNPQWVAGLGTFDCVVTLQAVHELRHKRHAARLHREVRELLRPGGLYLVCDHFFGPGGLDNDRLYMPEPEQRAALTEAGFSDVSPVMVRGSLALHRARA